MKRVTLWDVAGAAIFAGLAGAVLGAQAAHREHRTDCAEVIVAERQCMAYVEDLTDRLAALVAACSYGAGFPTPEGDV